MMIKNKLRNASSRTSRGFLATGPGTPAGPDSLRLFTTKLHDNGIHDESTPFDFGRWTIFVIALAFPAWAGLTEGLGRGSYLPNTRKTPNPQLI